MPRVARKPKAKPAPAPAPAEEVSAEPPPPARAAAPPPPPEAPLQPPSRPIEPTPPEEEPKLDGDRAPHRDKIASSLNIAKLQAMSMTELNGMARELSVENF